AVKHLTHLLEMFRGNALPVVADRQISRFTVHLNINLDKGIAPIPVTNGIGDDIIQNDLQPPAVTIERTLLIHSDYFFHRLPGGSGETELIERLFDNRFKHHLLPAYLKTGIA